MGKVYTRFQTKKAQMGGTYLYGLYKGVPPPLGVLPHSIDIIKRFWWSYS